MANPKYIDESLLPDPTESNDKKVTKKAYSFRCDESLLEDITKYAEIEGASLPQILNDMIRDFLENKTLTNTYLPEYEGSYINIPSNVDGMYHKSFEYELRAVVNNLDEWSSKYGYAAKHRRTTGILHEGIDFLVIPETVHLSKLPEDAAAGGIMYTMNLHKISDCLYCMYITVTANGTVNYEVISWIDAMNKLKEVERYDLISHANTIKKKLDKLHQEYLNTVGMYDEDIVAYNLYGKLLKIASDFNTGAILPASKSIDKIEYTPIVKQLPDNYALVNKLMKENRELKKIANEFQAFKDKFKEIERKSRDEVWEEFIQEQGKKEDDLPEGHDE